MSDLTCMELLVPEEHIDSLTGFLFQFISFGWEEERLLTGETLFRIYSDNQSLVDTVSTYVQDYSSDIVLQIKQTQVQDWTIAWREFFTPVHAGRFLVLPPWLVEETTFEDGHILVIEPKSAFGTGHHATTVLCLEAIGLFATNKDFHPGMYFFDLGTGTGILSIACAQLGLKGLSVDIDPIAVSNALENAELNNVTEHIIIAEAGIEAGEGQFFDLIIANILAEPLKDFAPQLIRYLTPGGSLILSGILDIQADAVEDRYSQLGKAKRLISGDWVALTWNL